MPALSENELRDLLQPFLTAPAGDQAGASLLWTPDEALVAALDRYLDVLLLWNARTNLTSIREPKEIVRRHFGESLLAARCLRPHLTAGDEVLDLGSGAGFPGLPLSLALPELRVTLAESQGKKAAFLREATRQTGSSATVWAGRTETLPAGRRFRAVTLRAVDHSALAETEARRLLLPGGWSVQFLTRDTGEPTETELELFAVPGQTRSYVAVRCEVPA